MKFERLRRSIFMIAAIALFFVTVLPNNIVSAGMADEQAAVATVSAKMPCPDCNNNMIKASITACAQMTCIGFAIIAEDDFVFSMTRGTFFQTAALQPDEIHFAPATPPI